MLQSRWIMLALLALVASLAIAPNNLVLAQPNSDSGVPGGPFSTAFRVQNLGSSNATCTYSVYNASGTQSFNSPLPSINPGTSAYVYTPSVTSFPSGVFSAVISCDQPVAAVVNYSDNDSGDTFVGISSPATKLYVPGVYDNYYNYYTSLRVMNASNSTNNVTIKYYDGATEITGAQDTFTLSPNGSRAVIHENRTGFVNNKIYSAVIEGSQPLAAVVQIYGKGPYDQQLYAYTAFSGGATKAYVPLAMSNYYGYDTATSVQNVGTTATQVKITYSNGTTQTVTLSSGASHTFLDFNLLPSANSTYSAVVESIGINPNPAQPIIVTVNESRRGSKLATTYEGFSSGATTWVAPIVMKNYYNFQSSITCQNIGNAPANISVAFKGEASGGPVNIPSQVKVSNLGVNQSAAILQQFDSSLPSGFIGSAEITSNQNIICVVNQSNQNVGTTQDQLYAYDALIKP
ncbi:hypothetical protein Cagg_2302 [Chloroflexus aggregans DSM 9485]|uniref:CARDB domain-containing protein n=1 Tax=Chloroflexus aggregans (strain MD-66 / DSM 9485) TaxID=326427 RepID=B8GDB4_CHLAD|nr:hypothetical protein Cagg_2302 [Chloroflexus aggregans DSM 9485]